MAASKTKTAARGAGDAKGKSGGKAEPPTPDLTIDELAHETGMTARNIRAHQSRGLLPPPEVRARTGYYGPDHVARIKLIQDMQGQGFNLKAIERLLELGADASAEHALALERAVLRPFGDEQPEVLTAEDLASTFGPYADARSIQKAVKIGAIRPLGDDKFEAPSPTLLRAAGELVEVGVPLTHALAVGDSIRKHTGAIAREFVKLFVQDVFDPIRDGTAEDGGLARAEEIVERLRPLASEAVMASFGQVMTQAVEDYFERELSR